MTVKIDDALFPTDSHLEVSVSQGGHHLLLETVGTSLVALDAEGVLKLVRAAGRFVESQPKTVELEG